MSERTWSVQLLIFVGRVEFVTGDFLCKKTRHWNWFQKSILAHDSSSFIFALMPEFIKGPSKYRSAWWWGYNISDFFFFFNQAEKTSVMAGSDIRNLWNTYQVDQSDTSDSNTEEDQGELAGRKLCKLFSQRLHWDKIYTVCGLPVAEMLI